VVKHLKDLRWLPGFLRTHILGKFGVSTINRSGQVGASARRARRERKFSLGLSAGFSPSKCLRRPARVQTAQPLAGLEWIATAVRTWRIGYANRIARARKLIPGKLRLLAFDFAAQN